MLPQLYTDGMLVAGDAAALVLATGRALEGFNFALASGIAAAETVKIAREKGDFSRQTLSQYARLLAESFVLQDLWRFHGAPQLPGEPAPVQHLSGPGLRPGREESSRWTASPR